MKKLLLIINPVSGTKKANKYLADMLTELSTRGYECSVQATTPELSAEQIARELSPEKDLVICIGGDGTLNETVSGCLTAKVNTPLGYIPSGSTNDFANGLGLSQHPMSALRNILDGEVHPIDVGTFNGRPFVYTASFGVFTKASYSAPREMRNNLGYFAYVLEGAKEIGDIKSYRMCFNTDNDSVSGDYIFGGICNSKRIGGGMVRFSDEIVDLNDGKLEVFLVKTPKNAGEFMQLMFDFNTGNYNSPFIEFFSTDKLSVITNDNIDWTLDGEFQRGDVETKIEVLPGAMQLQY